MSEKPPLISVIMSAFNEERFIGKAVASIFNQTFKDYEFIVINDGSTDGTATILEGIKDERLKVYHSTKSQGLTVSLNLALVHAQGKYIARMDADDLCAPNRLEMQVSIMENTPNLGLVGSWHTIIDEQEKILVEKKLPIGERLKAELPLENFFCHGSVLFRREVMEKVGSYRKEFRYAQDYDLWLRISDSYEVDNVPKFLYCSRLHGGNISVKKRWLQHQYAVFAQKARAYRHKGLAEPLWELDKLSAESIQFTEYLVQIIRGYTTPFLLRHHLDPSPLYRRIKKWAKIYQYK